MTDFDPLIKSAQSDASKALAQIADTANALSDAKTAFGSGVAEAKELAITAQTTANSAVESAGENAKELASQANALSDAKKAIDSDVASAKGLANAAQSTADNAIKSASSVADDLTAVASQAKANANGITKVTSDVGLLQTTVANNTGDISTIQETAKQIQQAVSDNAGNITVAKQTADSAVAVASDAKSNATVAVQTASGASVTAKNAQGDATTAMTTANSAVIQASDAKSNATIAVQTASEASLTATNAQGDASIAKQTASDASVQIKNAQGDISKLQTRAGAIETSVANNSGAIADVQATANQLKASVSDNSGAIVVATQTAQGAATVASDAKSNATVAIQTASQANITASNASGQAASAVITANGAMTTASDAKSSATVAIQTASGASLTATNAQGDASIAKQTASEAKVQASNAESDFAQISIRAGQIEASVANNSGAIASVQQTANGLTTTVADIKANGGGRNYLRDSDKSISGWAQDLGTMPNEVLNSLAGKTITVSVDTEWSNYQHSDSQQNRLGFELAISGSDGKSYWFGAWKWPSTPSGKERVSTTFTLPANVTFTVNNNGLNGYVGINGTGKVSHAKIEEGTIAHDWSPAPEDLQNQFTQIKQSIDGVTTVISDPKTGLNATYQTAAGNATTISNVKSDVYQLQTTANGLTSRVGNLESKTNTQETAIEQNKSSIALKADQTDVDKINGTVNQLQSTLTVQAGQIQEKVTSSQVTGMLAGYATQEYTQSLVTQKADDWNLNLTNLKTDVNAIKTTGGGVNLWINSKSFANTAINNPTVDWNTGSDGIATAHITSTTSSGRFYGKWNAIYANSTEPFAIGDSETFSVEMKGSGTFTIGREGDFTKVVTLTSNWTRYAVSGTVNSANKAHIIYHAKSESCDAYVRLPMVEKGTVAHDWSPAPSDMATVTSVTNLSATVDGIKSTVATKADQSTITELSNLVQTKVSSGDFTSTTTQLKNLINQRVQVGDVISQINQEAGGNTLIQVSNGKGSLILNADNTIITGKAWIPDAAIGSISADKIMLGSSALYNSDGTFNLVNQNNNLKALIQVKQGLVQDTTQSIISFSSDYNNRAFTITPVGATVTPTLFFERYDQTPDHWLGFSRNEVQREGLTFNTWDNEGERFFVDCHARFHKNLSTEGIIYQGSWNNTTGKPLAGILSIESGNTIWSGSGYLAIGDHVSNSYTNVIAKSFSQQSTLSSKTNIEEVDPKDALDLVNQTDIRSYQYKSDVEQGKTKRYTSLIIDDVNDVSKYYAPDEFTNEERTGRDDGSAVGYLFLAVQELTRRIKNLEEKLNG